MLHWHCVCDADNGVAVSVNDIIGASLLAPNVMYAVNECTISHLYNVA